MGHRGLRPVRGQFHPPRRRSSRGARACPPGGPGRFAGSGRCPTLRVPLRLGGSSRCVGVLVPASRLAGPVGAARAPCGGHARILRLIQRRWLPGRKPFPLPGTDGPGRLGSRPRNQLDPVPWARRRSGPRGWAGGPRHPKSGARVCCWSVQGDRARRGRLRPVQQFSHRPAPSGTGHQRSARVLYARTRGDRGGPGGVLLA
jgi:hypothetical protein